MNNPTYKLPALNRRYVLVVSLFLVLASLAKAQPPADAISMEDAAFNQYFLQQKPATVSVKILNATAEELKKIKVEYSIVSLPETKNSTQRAVLSPDGHFEIVPPKAYPYQQIWLHVNQLFYTALYLHKGLQLELDYAKLNGQYRMGSGEGVQFSGQDGTMNDYLSSYFSYRIIDKRRFNDSAFHLLYVQKDDSTFLHRYNRNEDSVQSIQNEYVKKYPSAYSWILENERLSNYYKDICGHYWNKLMSDSMWQKVQSHKSYIVSNDGTSFYSHLSTYLQTNHEYLPTSTAELEKLPNLSATEKAIIDSINSCDSNPDSILTTIPKKHKWLNQLQPRFAEISIPRQVQREATYMDSCFAQSKADLLKLSMIRRPDPEENKLLLEKVYKATQTEWCKLLLKEELAQNASKINQINQSLSNATSISTPVQLGTPIVQTAFGASLYKATTKNAAQLVQQLKAALPDKAIIIDRWATWCSPCLDEMPHSKKLQIESKDLPVTFVYLCTERSSSEEKWKKKIAELGLPGIHILMDEELDAEVGTFFSFGGYPGYAYLNRKGEYKPGAIQRISFVQDKAALAEIINRNGFVA